MTNYPWKSAGICLFSPHHDEVDRFCGFVKNTLAADGIDTIVMIIRYNFNFASHPECIGDYPLTKEDVRKMVAACRECGINLIPDMNLLGHQTVQDSHAPDGLLRGHPEFCETPIEEEPEYSYSLCPNAPGLYEVVCDLIDEIADAFEATDFHIGVDEVFYIGLCDRCKGQDPGDLLAAWVTKLHDYLAAKGIRMLMWGDRLLDSRACGHGPWDASMNGTHTALGKIPTDIVITDWHYHNWPRFPSVEVFAEAGHRIWLCPFNVAENAKLFLDYAKEHDRGNIIGIMETTWTPVSYLMDGLEGKELVDDGKWYKGSTPHIVRCYKSIFRPDEPWDEVPQEEE
ncbi:MAG: family 20 glycosylhydrolase [Clostridia bacterium]|nr:family 20 glycosylhydrolase [Clostridia bacterium]